MTEFNDLYVYCPDCGRRSAARASDGTCPECHGDMVPAHEYEPDQPCLCPDDVNGVPPRECPGCGKEIPLCNCGRYDRDEVTEGD